MMLILSKNMSKKCCVCLATCISLKDPFTVLKNGLTLVEAILLTKVSTQEAITFSWEFATEPVEVDNLKPTAHIILDGSLFKKYGLMNALHALEDILYGTDSASAKLPFPNEIKDQVEFHKYLRDSNGNIIYDHNNQPIESSVFH